MEPESSSSDHSAPATSSAEVSEPLGMKREVQEAILAGMIDVQMSSSEMMYERALERLGRPVLEMTIVATEAEYLASYARCMGDGNWMPYIKEQLDANLAAMRVHAKEPAP